MCENECLHLIIAEYLVWPWPEPKSCTCCSFPSFAYISAQTRARLAGTGTPLLANVIRLVPPNDQQMMPTSKPPFRLLVSKTVIGYRSCSKSTIIVDKSNIDKKARTELPSFSTVKWTDFATRAGHPENPSDLQLEYSSLSTSTFVPYGCLQELIRSFRAQDVPRGSRTDERAI